MKRGESKGKRKEWDGQRRGEQEERMETREGRTGEITEKRACYLWLETSKLQKHTQVLVPSDNFFTPDLPKFSKNLSWVAPL